MPDLESGLQEILARYAEPVEFTPFAAFIEKEEDTAEPLLGTKEETILPADGFLLMYGDGGAGKTTLSVDAAAHLGSGMPWLGISIPRPVRVTLIENEGPRGKFRQMLREKSSAWNGKGDFTANLTVLEEPWTRFTLQEDEHRMALAEHVARTEADVVMMGPLVTLGMVGGGTPDEISAFETLISKTRQLCSRPFAFWVVHHENKAGDVSGAWERVPDTLCHIQAQGNGHTRLHWRKARWSSESHGTSIDLVWSAGRSFEVVEKKERDPWVEMEAAFRHANAWRTAKESGKLIQLSEAEAKKVLAELVRRGIFEYEEGPHGRGATAKCWRLKDGIEGALMDTAHLSAPTPETAHDEQGARLRSPVRGAAARSAPAVDSGAARTALSAPDADDHDPLPF